MTGLTNEILTVLTQSKSFISGESISDTFGISRAAVWKHMNKLKEAGYIIESVRNKGYKLVESPDRISRQMLMDQLSSGLLNQIYVYDSIDSTNDEAKRLAVEDPNTFLVVSEEQKAGKGRRGRQWASPKHQGIYMSFLLRPEFETQHASKLTLIAGLSVNEVIQELTGLNTSIKWPNDIVLNGKKVAGILTEMATEMNEIRYVVLGIGLNISGSDVMDQVKNTSITLESVGRQVDRNHLIVRITERFFVYYRRFLEDTTLVPLLDAYNDQCITTGSMVTIHQRQSVKIGKAIEVIEDGGLKIETAQGEEIVYSGEVSVRGLYGYSE